MALTRTGTWLGLTVGLALGMGPWHDALAVKVDPSFGDFDPRRTQVHAPIYLLETRTVVFDLTAEPDAPAEPWRGALDGIRLDLVDGFEDALGEPTSGWWEVEAIRMY